MTIKLRDVPTAKQGHHFPCELAGFLIGKTQKVEFFRQILMREPTQTTRLTNSEAPVCRLDDSPSQSPVVTTKLLISIRNSAEAALVRGAGVDWIDLKEPHAGSLGRSSLLEARSVAELLSDHPQRSAALGELHDLDEKVAFEFASLFPILKVGLSRLGANDWQTRFESLAAGLRERGTELIPVAYADCAICMAPRLSEILEFAHRVGSSHLLIDTHIKDGRSLLDWIGLDELQRAIAVARGHQCGIVLAGSLKFDDVPKLLRLQPAALAVRGAVCHSDTSTCESPAFAKQRTSPIDLSKVARWRACF